MKKTLLLLIVFVLVACTPSKEEKIFSDFDKKYGEEEKSCLKQEKLIQESTLSHQNDVFLVHDETAALKTIESINLNLLSRARYRSHYILLQQHCFHDKKGISYTCPDSLSGYLFFRALIITATSSAWSKTTNGKAIKLASQFIQKQTSENEGGLLDKGLSLQLLELMVQKNIINKEILPEIQKLSEQVENDRKSIKTGKRLGCEEALKHDQQEMELTKIISQKMIPLLSSLPK